MFKRAILTVARAVRQGSQSSTAATGIAGMRAAGYASRAVASSKAGVSFNGLGVLLLTGMAAAGSMALAQEACAAPNERTFIMIKPDGVHRGLVADIIKRFEQKGYKLVGIRVMVPPKDLAEAHYAEHAQRPFFPKLVNFLSSGAVVAMVWEGKDAIKTGRQMIGATNPLASAPGTIRGDFGIDVGRNIIHGSDSVESAQREIALWFKPEDLAQYELNTKPWIYE